MSPILVTFTSPSDSNFEQSNISLKENKPYGVDPNSNSFYYCVRKKEGRTLRVEEVKLNRTTPSISLSAYLDFCILAVLFLIKLLKTRSETVTRKCSTVTYLKLPMRVCKVKKNRVCLETNHMP